jgi:phosphoglycolate phosphatase
LRDVSFVPRGVIFDLDGTLVDSAGEIAEALARTFEGFALEPIARAEVEKMIGRGVRVLVERAFAFRRVTGVDLDDAVAAFEMHYAKTVGRDAALFDGAREAIDALYARGVPMAVVTNKPRYFTLQLLATLGVDHFFGCVIAGDDGIVRKPAGDMLIEAARRMGCQPAQALMVGDSDNDVTAARNAGCPVWCVRHGYNEGRPVEALGADRLLDSLAELPRLLAA